MRESEIRKLAEQVYVKDDDLAVGPRVTFEALQELWGRLERECEARDWSILWAGDLITDMRLLLTRLRMQILTRQVEGVPCPAHGSHELEVWVGVSLEELRSIDVDTLIEKGRHYGDSWKKRGFIGAFFVIVRKWDRLLNWNKSRGEGDFQEALRADTRQEGTLDDIDDLRRYLLLVDMERLSCECGHLQSEHDTPERGPGCAYCDCDSLKI